MEFPLGAAVTLEQLDRDPHPVLARLREREPVSWIPALDGWLVTRYDLVTEAMRDSATFTVDDPRFSTAQVIGPSMLSLDGEAHDAPPCAVRRAVPAAGGRRSVHESPTAEHANRLLDELAPRGAASSGAGSRGRSRPRSSSARSGLSRGEVDPVLGWYDAIVEAVTSITAGTGITTAGEQAFAELQIARCSSAIDGERLAARRGRRRRAAHARSRSSRTRRCCCSAGSRRPRG